MALTTVYQLKTFADIVSAVLEELKIQSTDTTVVNRIKRNINIVYLDEVIPCSDWKWLRGASSVVQKAAITTGSVTCTNGSTAATLTSAPAISVKGYRFRADNSTEIYQVAQHTAGSTSLVLESPFLGTTGSGLSYHLWTEKIPLPQNFRDLIAVGHDYSSESLEMMGIQQLRRHMQSSGVAEDRPQFASIGDWIDPTPFVAVGGLPATVSRSSIGLVKTLVFASDMTGYLRVGDRIEISSAGNSNYNGRFTVSGVSSTAVTYTGLASLQESTTADTSAVLNRLESKTDSARYRELLVHPSIYSSDTLLHVDYIKEVSPLIEDADEPLMPVSDRVVLLYGALAMSWARERKPEDAQRNFGLYERKLAKMQGKLDESVDYPVLMVSRDYLAAKRRGSRRFSNWLNQIWTKE